MEKGVPIPEGRRNRIYPVRALDVGDSFFVAKGNANSISACVSHYAKGTPKRFKTMKVEGGVRVWRLA